MAESMRSCIPKQNDKGRFRYSLVLTDFSFLDVISDNLLFYLKEKWKPNQALMYRK